MRDGRMENKMKTLTLRIFTLGLTLAFAAALFILKQNAVQAFAPSPSTFAAADIERACHIFASRGSAQRSFGMSGVQPGLPGSWS